MESRVTTVTALTGRGNRFTRNRSGVLAGVLGVGSVPIARVVAPEAMLFHIGTRVAIRSFLGRRVGAPFSHPLVCDRSDSGVVNFARHLRLFSTVRRNRKGHSLNSVVHPVRVIVDASALPGTFRRLVGRETRLTLIVSRCNAIRNLLALRSVFRCVINRRVVSRTSGAASVRRLTRRH